MVELFNYFEGYIDHQKRFKKKKDYLSIWSSFMDRYPVLKQHCIDDYEELGYDWREIAQNKVFVYGEEELNNMQKAMVILEDIYHSIGAKLEAFFGVDVEDVNVILYHGLGNGAGSATYYLNKPSILFGLEKIVELRWDTKARLEDLFAHEYGHIMHMVIRNDDLEPFEDYKRKQIFRMYIEGVAVFCERLSSGREVTSEKWVELGQQEEQNLKQEFLKRFSNHDDDIQDFFGDWNPVFGLYEAGYYLGYQVVKAWKKRYSLLEIMNFPYEKIEVDIIDYLKEIS